jgi:hypothetical protein
MQKISREPTFTDKGLVIFPFIIAAIMGTLFFTMQKFAEKPVPSGANIIMTSFLVGIPIIFLFAFRGAFRPLEEVFVSEDALLVRRQGEEDSIPFADIESMKHAGGMSTRGPLGRVQHRTMLFRITLKAKRKFGKTMTFWVASELCRNPAALLELASNMQMIQPYQ